MRNNEIPLEDTGKVFVGTYGYTKEINMPEKVISYKQEMEALQRKVKIYERKFDIIRGHARDLMEYFKECQDDLAMKELERLNDTLESI